MILQTLQIADFRNIRAADLHCSPTLNLISGPNAAGKTSVLEAVYFLGHARSFRTARPDQLIRDEAQAFRLIARIGGLAAEAPVLGMERSRKGQEIRWAGQPVQKVSELARLLPQVLLTTDLHRLLENGPRERRRFLDWGLFHVEPGFHPVWNRYRQALTQRNAALRRGLAKEGVMAWDPPLLQAAEALHRARSRYVEALTPHFQRLIDLLMDMGGIELRYNAGWSQAVSLRDCLITGWEGDRAQGYTHSGPHRADLRFVAQGRDLAQHLSRGQQKQLIIALFLAQAALLRERRDRGCQFLLDDLSAELDPEHRRRVMRELKAIGAQIFLTAIETGNLAVEEWEGASRFHVEHGQLREVI